MLATVQRSHHISTTIPTSTIHRHGARHRPHQQPSNELLDPGPAQIRPWNRRHRNSMTARPDNPTLTRATAATPSLIRQQDERRMPQMSTRSAAEAGVAGAPLRKPSGCYVAATGERAVPVEVLIFRLPGVVG